MASPVPMWTSEISNEKQKRSLAIKVAARAESDQVIGLGSGSTSYLTVLELAKRVNQEGLQIKVIPTSIETSVTASDLGLTVVALEDARPDWCFDGADEVDPNGDLIKGRGGAMLREKQVIDSASHVVIVVDQTKLVDRLGAKFAIPVEVAPLSLRSAEKALSGIGAIELGLRTGPGKDGPTITEHGNVIFDVRFAEVTPGLEAEIDAIDGVRASGLFQGRHPEVLTDA